MPQILYVFEQSRQTTLHNRVVETIKVLIDTGAYPPGSYLPSRRSLARRLKVSPATVQYAFTKLIKEGVLISAPPKPVRVRPLPGQEDLPPPASVLAESSFHFYRSAPAAAAPAEAPAAAPATTPPAAATQPPASAVMVGTTKISPTYSLARPLSRAYACNKKKIKTKRPNPLDEIPPIDPMPAFMEKVRGLLGKRGIHVSTEHIAFVPEGRALEMLLACLVRQGDCVVTDQPGDLSTTDIFLKAGAELRYTGSDEQGMLTENLQTICQQQRVKAIFVKPSASNIFGQTLSPARRAHLVELALKYNIPIIDSDLYQELWSTKAPAPLISYPHNGHVLHIGCLSPLDRHTLPAGIVVGNADIIEAIRERNALFGNTLSGQSIRALTAVMDHDHFVAYMKLARKDYRQLLRFARKSYDILLAQHADIFLPQAGMSFYLRFHKPLRRADLEAMLRPSLQPVVFHNAYGPDDLVEGMMYGIGEASEQDIARTFRLLKELLTSTT